MPGGGVGVQAPEASPSRYVRRRDEVLPDDDGCGDVEVRGPEDDPFDIPAKRAPVERLRRWRVSPAFPTQLCHSIGFGLCLQCDLISCTRLPFFRRVVVQVLAYFWVVCYPPKCVGLVEHCLSNLLLFIATNY